MVVPAVESRHGPTCVEGCGDNDVGGLNPARDVVWVDRAVGFLRDRDGEQAQDQGRPNGDTLTDVERIRRRPQRQTRNAAVQQGKIQVAV